MRGSDFIKSARLAGAARRRFAGRHPSALDVLGQSILRALDNIKAVGAGDFRIELGRAASEGREVGDLTG